MGIYIMINDFSGSDRNNWKWKPVIEKRIASKRKRKILQDTVRRIDGVCPDI